MKIRPVLVYWLPVLVWMGVIFTFSSFPTASTSDFYWQDFVIKKTAHIIEYAILAVLLYRAQTRSLGFSSKKAGIIAVLVGVMYGASDEFHQSFTPGRGPKARDVIFDTIGSGLAIFIIWKYLPRAPKTLKTLATKLELI